MRSSPRLLLALFVLPLVFAGCASPEVIRRIPISGGQIASFSFGPKGVEPGRANGYEVQLATFLPGKDAKDVFYRFAVSTPAGAQLKRVQVEDVSEEDAAPFSLVDDASPAVKDGRWEGDSAIHRAGSPHLQWVYTITTTMRVYRFTLTDTAGKKTEILHVTGYPDFVKSAVRKKWGENY